MSTTASAAATGSGGQPGSAGARGAAGGSGRAAGSALDTGFSRVTIVAPDSRIDVALPEDIPVADLYPEILRLRPDPRRGRSRRLPPGAPRRHGPGQLPVVRRPAHPGRRRAEPAPVRGVAAARRLRRRLRRRRLGRHPRPAAVGRRHDACRRTDRRRSAAVADGGRAVVLRPGRPRHARTRRRPGRRHRSAPGGAVRGTCPRLRGPPHLGHPGPDGHAAPHGGGQRPAAPGGRARHRQAAVPPRLCDRPAGRHPADRAHPRRGRPVRRCRLHRDHRHPDHLHRDRRRPASDRDGRRLRAGRRRCPRLPAEPLDPFRPAAHRLRGHPHPDERLRRRPGRRPRDPGSDRRRADRGTGTARPRTAGRPGRRLRGRGRRLHRRTQLLRLGLGTAARPRHGARDAAAGPPSSATPPRSAARWRPDWRPCCCSVPGWRETSPPTATRCAPCG